MIKQNMNNDTGIFTVTLNRPKVNAQNTALLQELADTFEVAQKDEAVKGILFKGEGKCFPAGLDLQEVLSFDKKGLSEFWHCLNAPMRLCMK